MKYTLQNTYIDQQLAQLRAKAIDESCLQERMMINNCRNTIGYFINLASKIHAEEGQHVSEVIGMFCSVIHRTIMMVGMDEYYSASARSVLNADIKELNTLLDEKNIDVFFQKV